MAGRWQEQAAVHLFSGNPVSYRSPVSGRRVQQMCWYSADGTEAYIGRVVRGVSSWRSGAEVHQFTGAARTALGMPIDTADDHLFINPSVPDWMGRTWVAGNLHNYDTLGPRLLVSAPNEINSWTPAPDAMPGIEGQISYPVFTRLANGTLMAAWRDSPNTHGGTAMGNWSYYLLRVGSLVWERVPWMRGVPLSGPGSETNDPLDDNEFNFSAYITHPRVQSARHPHPGEVDVANIWRQFDTGGAESPEIIDRTNLFPGFHRNRNHAEPEDWTTIEGVGLTLPLEPWNDQGEQTGLVCPDNQAVPGYINFGGLAMEANDGPVPGRPHLLWSTNPTYHGSYDPEAGWWQEGIPTVIDGLALHSRKNAIWWRGRLWALCTCSRSSGNLAGVRSSFLVPLDGGAPIRMGRQVGTPNGWWEPGCDWNMLDDEDEVHVMYIGGSTPYVHSVGGHALLSAV